jgi:ABC-2 type transport system permease protein
VASGWMNFAMLPMWLLSGTFFDYTRFPEVVHPFIRALPLTAVNDALRGLINHGTSVTALGIEVGVLALWGIISFFLALRFFRWQ